MFENDQNSKRHAPKKRYSFLQHLGRFPGVVKVATMISCALDPETPWIVRVTGLFAIFYLIFPIDLIPDVFIFLFGAGLLDDAAILYMAYKTAENHIQPWHKAKALAFFNLTEDDLH